MKPLSSDQARRYAEHLANDPSFPRDVQRAREMVESEDNSDRIEAADFLSWAARVQGLLAREDDASDCETPELRPDAPDVGSFNESFIRCGACPNCLLGGALRGVVGELERIRAAWQRIVAERSWWSEGHVVVEANDVEQILNGP